MHIYQMILHFYAVERPAWKNIIHPDKEKNKISFRYKYNNDLKQKKKKKNELSSRTVTEMSYHK